MNIHIFSFIRNETYLLQKWIPYHSSIAGLKNIHIIDHKSDEPHCITLLKKYEKRGLDVIKTSKDFSLKHKLLSQLMHQYKSDADILIPLDADEFLCLSNSDQSIIADLEDINKYLNTLPVNGKKYAFHVYEAVLEQVDYDDPLLEMKTFEYYPASKTAAGPNQQTKTFYPAKNFGYTDQGNHKGGVLLAPNDEYNLSKMAIAHYHMRGFTHFMKKMEKAMDAYHLKNLPPDFVGTGMRWNRWYQQTKNLNHEQKRMWFEENFVKKEAGKMQVALSETFKKLN